MQTPFTVMRFLCLVCLVCDGFSISGSAQIIYIGESYSTIEAYSTNGTDLGTFASGTPQVEIPAGLAINSTGNLFESDFDNFSIQQFNSSGMATTFANSSSGLNDPWGLVFDQSGDLYVANSGLQSILKFTPAGNFSTFAARTPSKAPYALAIDGSGNLYASYMATGSTTIEKFSPNGSQSLFANTGDDEFFGMTVGPDGFLYGSDFDNNTVYKFLANGTKVVFATTGLNEPTGLAFDGNGNLYVINQGNDTVEKFNSTGTGNFFVKLASNNVNQPLSIAIAAPEPSSSLMVLLAGSLFFLVRRCGLLAVTRRS